ncbi:hypothetical protein EV177_008800 [Coemansia sp. RSA 1804]|nr:hypothetical protein EV177_008800 [Coemansia sp. RSA 1804]
MTLLDTGARLAHNLRRKFGKDPVLIFGNWSADMVRYHEPIRGKGWRMILKRLRFRVYLIDKFRTSSICPVCNSSLEKFHWVCNPRPWQRKKTLSVMCHGLLRCKNETCLKSVAKYEESNRRRLWNHDTVAVLNMLHILFSLRKNKCIPEHFQHSTPKAKCKSKTVMTTKRPAKRPKPSDDDQPLIKLLKLSPLCDSNSTS